MKVVLMQDVPKIGKKFEIKNVADGYGRNFLLAKGLAKLATKDTEKSLSKMMAQENAKRKILDDILEKNLNSLEGSEVTIAGKTNEEGHLFAGIHKDEVVKAIKEQTGLDISEEMLNLEKPYKEVGEFDLTAEAGKKKAVFKVKVEKTA